MRSNDEQLIAELLQQEPGTFRTTATLRVEEAEYRRAIADVRAACACLREHCEPVTQLPYERLLPRDSTSWKTVSTSSREWLRWLFPWAAIATIPMVGFAIFTLTRTPSDAVDFATIDRFVEREVAQEEEVVNWEDSDVEYLNESLNDDIQLTTLLYDYEY